MNEVKETRWASAKRNDDFFLIETFSGYRGSNRDPQGMQYTLPRIASAQELGEALIDALAHSRFLSIDEIDEFFEPLKSAALYQLWIQELMQRHGYKTKQALFKSMECCHVSQVVGDGDLRFGPMRHTQLESWRLTKDDGIEDVVIAADSSPEAVGEALLLAFSRCG